jgi:uncharacterized protein YukE
MSDQVADTDALRALTEALTEMVTYTDALRAGASAFAYMLPAEWQGPAFSRFLSAFEVWAATATALTEETSALQAHVAHVLASYEQGIGELDGIWSSYRAQVGA